MKKQGLKLTKTMLDFINYSFDGKRTGKYYTTEYGNQSFKNTIFQNFVNRNDGVIEKVIECGNDAPKGGKVGNYMIVKFSKKFMNIVNELKRVENEKEQAYLSRTKFVEENKTEILNQFKEKADETYRQTMKRVCDYVGGDFDGKYRIVAQIRRSWI